MDKNKLAEYWIDEKGYYNSGLRINTQHRVDLYLTDVLAEYHEYLASKGLLSNVSNSEQVAISKKEYRWLKKCEKDLESI